jgi:hypothetical protein
MLNKRRERHDGQEKEVSVPTEREARTRHYTSFCDVILWVYDGSLKERYTLRITRGFCP